MLRATYLGCWLSFYSLVGIEELVVGTLVVESNLPLRATYSLVGIEELVVGTLVVESNLVLLLA